MPGSSPQSNKEGDDLSEKPRGRTLTMVIAGANAVTDSEGNTSFNGAEGWQSTTVGALTLIYNIQSWDLSGYTLQDKTLFPQGLMMQDMSPLPIEVSSLPSCTRATIVSTTPLSVGDLSVYDNGHWRLPGSNGNTFLLDNIIQGRVQGFLTLTTFAGLQMTKETAWGSADATAGEKIWMCDAYLYPTIAFASLNTPDMAFVMPSIVATEPELQYLMRLSRSLEPVY